jgi:hypothetical protein
MVGYRESALCVCMSAVLSNYLVHVRRGAGCRNLGGVRGVAFGSRHGLL